MSASASQQTISQITDAVRGDIARSLNVAPTQVDPDLSFSDMGADSLILVEALNDVNQRFGIALAVGDLYENYNTITKLSQYALAHGTLPLRDAAPAPAPEQAAAPAGAPRARGAGDQQSLRHILDQQLKLMELQLQLLGNGPAQDMVARADTDAPAVPRATAPAAPPVDADGAAPDRFSAFSVKLGHDKQAQDAVATAHIGEMAVRLNGKTAQSKALTQAWRQVLADNRASAGFRPLLKEMVYPILAEGGHGAHLRDIDGNEYVDFTMGFGTHLFGHAPSFIVERIKEQLERGMPIGPQSPLAGKVAGLICELTGHDRVTFCNSGTEATMTALRLGRAKSGKDKVVVFKDSYHGTFDGFLARPHADGARPASLGTPASMVQDTIVLDYCDPKSLAYIEQHHAQIGVVLLEPVQSRAPSLQPGPFLHQLRELTRAHRIALVFDEVITGFRCAKGGAQEYFGVRADICTYGKILGGGMPIGVVAGSKAFMDGIDGGWWQYQDSSYPTAPAIFFAGTFSKHPLTLAAAVAVLEHIKANAAQIYAPINASTSALCGRINAVFEEEHVAVRVEHFSSQFRFTSASNIDLFFHHLLDAGFYIWEGRNCFVSTTHSEADFDRLVSAIRAICRLLAPLRLLPLRARAHAETPSALALSQAQQRFHVLHRTAAQGPVACNISAGLRFDKELDLERLERALARVLGSHESLSRRLDQGYQHSGAMSAAAVARVAVAQAASETAVDAVLAEFQNTPLDLRSGENIRARIFLFADHTTVLALCAHHIACDGWSMAALVEQIATLYGAPQRPADAAPSYALWTQHESAYQEGERHPKDVQFWRAAMARLASLRQAGPGAGGLNRIGARPGARARLALEEELTAQVAAAASADKATTFSWLLACFQIFLEKINLTPAPVIGIPLANRSTPALQGVVGNCVNLLPLLLPCAEPNAPFSATLAATRQAMGELFAHAQFPYAQLCAQYQHASASTDATPVEVTFNVEPMTDIPAFGGQVPHLIVPANHAIEFDLMCNIYFFKSGMRIELDYNRERFDAPGVFGWLNLFAKIVENQAKRPQLAGAPASARPGSELEECGVAG